MNVIFGSGIVGLIARDILGSNWTIVPFTRSRFYTFSPALADNFIVYDDRISEYLGFAGTSPKNMYKIRYSVMGNLDQHNDIVRTAWLAKLFGDQQPDHADIYMRSRTDFFVCDVLINKLYENLQNKYRDELMRAASLKPTTIGSHYFECDGKRYDFDHAINTIPYRAISKLCGKDVPENSRQEWYYHIETPDLDLEGANQALVVDPNFAFYKVNQIAPNRYLFFCTEEIPTPGPYFMQFMQRFDIIDGTTIENAIPLGPSPSQTWLKDMGITSIGAYAEHDWCADVGSNIMKLMKLPR